MDIRKNTAEVSCLGHKICVSSCFCFTQMFVTGSCVCGELESIIYRVFFFLWIQSGGCKLAILRSFKQRLYILHSKILAQFHFGTFYP